MPLVVGIDEAGYGPTLGPLVIGASLWNVPPRLVKSDFWQLLDDCVRRKTRRGEWRLAVNDSKTVYKRKQGISTLERPVLAFAHAAGLDCTTLSTLLAQVGADLDDADTLPWYRELDLPLPSDAAQSKFQAVAERLGHAMEHAGVCCRGLLAQVVTETRFNQRVAATHNKAAVLIEHVLRLITAAGEQAGDQDLVVRVDRLGGRTDYRPLLAAAFPERHMQIIAVSEECSRYRLSSERGDWFIEFAVSADQLHLPVALASMLAKYLREILMQRFNAFWQRKKPGIKPTAGYYTDARRFLGEMKATIAATGIPPERFVRLR